MKSSYKLATVRGIEVKIHITLLILLLIPVMELSSYADAMEGVAMASYTFAFLLVLFGSVLVHELAHAFVAISNRVKVAQITLWPLGGIASVGLVKDPWKELKISLAGPLTSIGIGFVLLFLLMGTVGGEAIADSIFSGDVLSMPSFINFVVLVMYINLILGAFNLFLPIFPMDGGRVLRAMLEMVTDRVKATRIAVMIGQGLLGIFIVLAIMVGSLWLVILGVFLFIAGVSELRITEMSAAVDHMNIKRLVRTGFMAIHPDVKVKDFLKIVSPRQTVYPVMDAHGKVLGVVETDRLKTKNGKVEDVMSKDFPIVDLKKTDDLLTKVYSKGYAFVLDGETLYGAVTLRDLESALSKEMKDQ